MKLPFSLSKKKAILPFMAFIIMKDVIYEKRTFTKETMKPASAETAPEHVLLHMSGSVTVYNTKTLSATLAVG